jgi:hypothetical protein
MKESHPMSNNSEILAVTNPSKRDFLWQTRVKAALDGSPLKLFVNW